MPKVLILNSYTLTEKPAAEQLRIRSFLDGLAEGGFRAGEDVDIEIIDSNSLDVLESRTIEALKAPPDLIHAVGTPNAMIAAKLTDNIPIVYYGTHPGGVGEAACRRDNICGVVLSLPLTANYKNFRFVRKLLPGVRRVYVPFYEGTMFCYPVMRERHRQFRISTGGLPWVPMDSEFVGYRCLSSLCYIIGLDYRELVYRDTEDLSRALAIVDSKDALVMPYNDSAYCPHAPRVLTRFGIETGIPLLWNNNPEATQIGALAAVASCFREVGLLTGRKAAAILAGASPGGVELEDSSKKYASINMMRARQLGLSVPEDVLSYFDEVIEEQ